MSGTQSRRPHQDGIEATVKDFWVSRPRRPRRGRKAAGVAAGIGNRYGIDPVIIRVVFVMATIVGGFGLLLYLLGWLFFAEEGDEVSGGEALFGNGQSSMSSAFAIVLAIALLPVASGAFSGMYFSGGGLFLLIALAIGLFLLHRSRGELNRPAVVGNGSAGTPAPAAFHAQPAADAGTGTIASVAGGSSSPPAEDQSGEQWDPLGAAPLGWDLPDNVTTAAVPATRRTLTVPRRNSRIVGMTIGIAVIVAAAGSALSLAGVAWFSPAHIIGLTLGVLGAGMVISAFTGGGGWLIALATPLALAGLVLTAAPLHELPRGGVGEIDEKPRTMSELEPVYERSVGSVRLDLTALPTSVDDANTARAGDVDVVVRAGVGEAVVVVPADAEVRFTCHSSIGTMECLGRERHGLGNQPLEGTDPGSDGRTVTVDVSSVLGAVEVRRG